MENASYIALAHQNAMWRKLDVAANNIANMNTPGYKGEQMMFVEYLERTDNSDSPFKERVIFPRDVGIARDMSEGTWEATDNPLDVAIAGDGFFVVETAAGEMYTRNGHFRLNQDGALIASNGNPVLSTNGTPFFFAPNESQINISETGTITTENGPIGQLRIVRFDDPQNMRKEADSLFYTDQEPQVVEEPKVHQGVLEGSNVNAVVEMTRLIDINRSYTNAQKMIESEHERQRRAMETFRGQV